MMVRRAISHCALAWLAILGFARAASHDTREVGIFLSGFSHRLESCGLTQDEVRRVVQSKLEDKGFHVISERDNPGGGVVWVYISAVEEADGSAAWSVRLELKEMARLERDPSRLSRATTWSGRSALTIGKSVAICRGVEGLLKEHARAIADDRLKLGEGDP